MRSLLLIAALLFVCGCSQPAGLQPPMQRAEAANYLTIPSDVETKVKSTPMRHPDRFSSVQAQSFGYQPLDEDHAPAQQAAPESALDLDILNTVEQPKN